MAEETKHDILLKRVQIIIAIVGGIIGVLIGIYNFKKAVKSEPPPAPVVVQQTAPAGGEIRSALEDAGASWIRKLAKAKEDK